MSDITVEKDPENLTMKVTTEVPAPVERAWELWGDPRKLERWWGPPSYPATMVTFDLTPGGRVAYYMTSPEGEKYHGWWRVISVDAPKRLEIQDGFADQDGNEVEHMPTSVMSVTLEERSSERTLMTIETRFPSKEAMEKTLEMGAEEGLKASLGQIDAVLAGEGAGT